MAAEGEGDDGGCREGEVHEGVGDDDPGVAVEAVPGCGEVIDREEVEEDGEGHGQEGEEGDVAEGGVEVEAAIRGDVNEQEEYGEFGDEDGE